MKLPEIRQGQVQGLARYDPRAPISAANAFGNAMMELGSVAKTWADAKDEASADLAASQAALEEAKLRTQLTQQRMYDKPDGSVVPMYEVMDQLYDEGVRDIRERYGDKLKTKQAKKLFSTKFNPKVAKGSQEIATGKFDQQYEHLKAQTDQAWEGYVLAGDEMNATAALAAGVRTGALTLPEYQEKLAETGQRIDTQQYQQMILGAETDAAREQLEVDLIEGTLHGRESRVSMEERLKMLSQLDRRSRLSDAAKTEEHERNTAELYSLHLSDQLTTATIKRALDNDLISYQQAMTLQTKIGEDTVVTSSKTALSTYRSAIVQLRFGQPGSEGMTARRDKIARDIQAAVTGMYPDGTPYQGTRLTGTDATTLLDDLDKEYGQAFSNPTYRNAVSLIKKSTGVSELVDFSKNANNTRAYIDFKNALDDYYEKNGYGADLGSFVNQHIERYHPSRYSAEGRKSVQNLQKLGVPASLFPVGEGRRGRAEMPEDPLHIKAWAFRQRNDGLMSDAEFNELEWELNASAPVTFEEYMQIEGSQP